LKPLLILDRFCVNSDLQDTEAVNRQSPYGAVITNDNNNIFVLTLKTFIPAGTIDIKSFGNAKPWWRNPESFIIELRELRKS